MNLPSFHASGIRRGGAPARRVRHPVSGASRCQSGSAVIVIMALLAILLIYVAGNLRTLANLGRELRLLERQQTRRLQMAAPRTNSPPGMTISTNSVSPPRTN
jgi:hypothetical protein